MSRLIYYLFECRVELICMHMYSQFGSFSPDPKVGVAKYRRFINHVIVAYVFHVPYKALSLFICHSFDHMPS